jgi:hypothetical protein
MAEDRIHGYPVIGRVATGEKRDGKSIDVVLVEKGDEYVTAKHVEGDPEWWYGHYFTHGPYTGHDKEEAMRQAKEDLARRITGKL